MKLPSPTFGVVRHSYGLLTFALAIMHGNGVSVRSCSRIVRSNYVWEDKKRYTRDLSTHIVCNRLCVCVCNTYFGEASYWPERAGFAHPDLQIHIQNQVSSLREQIGR